MDERVLRYQFAKNGVTRLLASPEDISTNWIKTLLKRARAV
jgi:hypothetical protein